MVASLARDFLFDDVYAPSEAVLDDTLLATRQSFCDGGREESAAFMGRRSARSADPLHMNRAYGAAVLREFVQPRLREVVAGVPAPA